MQIDRSRFLLLTASLAATTAATMTACDRDQHAATPDTGGAEPAHSKGEVTASSDTQPDPDGPSVWLEIEPGTEDTPHERLGNCSNTDRKPPLCALSAPSSHCESFESTLLLCESFPGFLQPRAAEAAIDCLHAASGTERICDWQIWNQCTGAGLQASCIEPGTRSECDSISSQCGGSVDVFTCQQALSAVRPQHLAQVASCVREFCEVPFA